VGGRSHERTLCLATKEKSLVEVAALNPFKQTDNSLEESRDRSLKIKRLSGVNPGIIPRGKI